jgi:Domain of unknown function (DUF4397)
MNPTAQAALASARTFRRPADEPQGVPTAPAGEPGGTGAGQPPRASRLVRRLAVLALFLGLLGYGGPAAFAAASAAAASPASAARAPASRSDGYLRLAHLSPNTPAVDVYLYPFGQASAIVVLRHVAYGTVSPYRNVASGEYTVAMRLAGTAPAAKPVLSTTVDVTAGHAYTVAGMGPKSGLRLQVIDDQLSCPPGRALVRVIQASLRQHLVTVTAGGQVLSRRQQFATVTSYRALRPGTWTLRAAGPGERAASQVTLAPGSIQTLIVLDDPGHLAITVLRDAAGSEVTPVGGAATGFGGTAARPGRSLVPWLALAVAGVVLTLAGVVRLRRVRWARRAVASIR